MNSYGISLYLGTGIIKNTEIIKKAKDAKVKYAFTSLHLPEENISDYNKEVEALLSLCKDAGIELIVDIGPRTIEKLGLPDIYSLKNTPITHIRVDYGFTNQEIADLSKDFHIVFNASTLSIDDLESLRALKVDFSKFSGCHNFYPKPLTGLSVDKVREINNRLHNYGVKTIGFVPGDKERRGPLHLGLPTVEEHRNNDLLEAVLQLRSLGQCDIILIGDVDVKEETWTKLKHLNENYIELEADIDEDYSYVRELIHHDRPDSSEYIIRSQESRGYATQGKPFEKEGVKPRTKGSISVGNIEYLRYSGELEIARIDLEEEEKVNIIGHIRNEHLKYLSYIDEGMGFRLI